MLILVFLKAVKNEKLQNGCSQLITQLTKRRKN